MVYARSDFSPHDNTMVVCMNIEDAQEIVSLSLDSNVFMYDGHTIRVPAGKRLFVCTVRIVQ